MAAGAESLHEALARARADADAAWARYHGLRRRKLVRAALVVARLVDRVRPPRPAPPPPPGAPVADPAPDVVEEPVLIGWDPGHHYSPIPDTRELGREPAASRVWPATPPESPGIDFRDEAQVALARAIADQEQMAFPSASTGDPTEYHTGNEFFSRLDAWALQGVLRHYGPRRMIEVGCGWSSLVTARVNREHLGGELAFTCIEPYPQPFLAADIEGITELLVSPVQDVPIERFQELRDGDVLFIDTAHVVKTGNDVIYLFHEVLPRLHRGVIVHIHDIFLPWDYPRDWVLAGRGWNEQYLVKSFLAFNDSFEVLLGIAWLHQFHPDVLAEAVPGYPAATPDGGASLWIRRSR